MEHEIFSSNEKVEKLREIQIRGPRVLYRRSAYVTDYFQTFSIDLCPQMNRTFIHDFGLWPSRRGWAYFKFKSLIINYKKTVKDNSTVFSLKNHKWCLLYCIKIFDFRNSFFKNYVKNKISNFFLYTVPQKTQLNFRLNLTITCHNELWQ